MIDKSVVDEIIIGRVEPHIYAFSTNTIPNYLKVGDTYRPVSARLKEWQVHFPELTKQYEGTAKISENVYFRDFAIHQFLENDRHKLRLQITDILPEVYYSKEFFKDATSADVKDAIFDIKTDYDDKTQKYQFYNAESRLAETFNYARTESFEPRPNQSATIDNFKTAVANGRTNLLMYAVMRFGKSFTSMCCAVEMNAKLVVIVSAKADVLLEWKKTVESHIKFADYDFISSADLLENNHIITEKLSAGRKVVVFLTLQDLQGDVIKDKHQEIFGRQIDLLLVDETHFGARAKKYGEVLKQDLNLKDALNKRDTDEDFVEIDDAEEHLKVIDRKITIHLSGTPYRILMGSEFKKEDIIAFYQFTDIVEDQEKWDKEHVLDDNYKEWDNPYYGFPQMVRFAFNPNESSRQKLKELKDSGVTYAFSALFKPQSIIKADDGSHKKFKYEREILDLLEVIDGSKTDNNLLGFLDYDKIKEGKMCRHIVIVLPYCASCDALQAMIESNRDKFRNLSRYEIINISGVDIANAYRSPKDIKKKVADFEAEGKKTITLTVNRMLTGSTVPEWDTMLYLKDTASPQEYDQAIFRLQNQYIKTFIDENGDTIKYNMKPQTLLVDFDPSRMFVMQEQKAQIYNVNVDDAGNTKLKERIITELNISPIVWLNNDKIVRVRETDILTAVSNYAKDKGIKDEALEISVDLDMLRFDVFRKIIEKENEIGSKSGLSTPAHEGENCEEGNDLNFPETEEPETPEIEEGQPDEETETQSTDDKRKEEISNTKRIQMYYTRILLYAFITKDRVISLSDIIAGMGTAEDARIAKNLGLAKDVLVLLNEHNNKWSLRQLDYKIQDLNDLSHSESLSAIERANVAVNKFGKLGEAIVITPSNICKDMVDMLPNEFMREVAENHGRLLDIAGTSGEFAVALYNKMKLLGIAENIIKESIVTIPKSSICYELTRKLYEMLGLNTDNIAEFIATDMLNIKDGDEIDYDKICKLLQQNKTFDQIKLDDDVSQGETDMLKFDAIVGNPPYQEDDGGNGISAKPIYNDFSILAINLIPKYLTLITPSRWFNGGKGLDKYRKKMLKDHHIEKIFDYQNAKDCFAELSIGGGVNYFLWNKDYDGPCSITNITKNHTMTMERYLDQYGTYIRYNSAVAIIEKVFENKENNILEFISSRNPFGLPTKTRGTLAMMPNSFVIYTSAGKQFISNNKVDKQNLYLDKYKLMISRMACEHAGEPDKAGKYRVISTMKVLLPNEVCSDSYIVAFPSDNEQYVINASNYLKTKFVRFLILQTLSSINLSKERYVFVPMQDFSRVWTDSDLYAKYNLTPEEIAFIESMIKPME